MRRASLAVVIAFGCSWFYIVDIDSVPLHPDESAWIFMSGDFDEIASGNIGRLIWTPDQHITDEIRLRLLNAPIAKYAIGAGRWLSGHRSERNARWNWLQTWEQNQQAGAMPASHLLRAARATAALAAALSLAIMFWLGCETVGLAAALIGTILLAIHPLTMVHGRRAMAESTAQLFSILAVFAVLRFVTTADRKPRTTQWRRAALLAGLATGLAIAAKQNAVAVAALGVLAGGLVPFSHPSRLRARLSDGAWVAGVTIITSALVYFALSPVMYREPFLSAHVMISLRQILSHSQAVQTATVAPQLATPTPASRARAAYDNLFWLPPAFSEYPDYDVAIAGQVARYKTERLTIVSDSLPVRLAFLVAVLLGLVATFRLVIRDKMSRDTRGGQLLIAWLTTHFAFAILALPMGWQRYFLPLLPPLCLFAGRGVVHSFSAFNLRLRLRQPNM
jgi:4-amino-4-deoxy-L-arabinose transferase-like glycosyltransferase